MARSYGRLSACLALQGSLQQKLDRRENNQFIGDLERMTAEAGFCDVRITPKDESHDFIKDWAPGRGMEDYVLSATIEAVKPGGGCC